MMSVSGRVAAPLQLHFARVEMHVQIVCIDGKLAADEDLQFGKTSRSALVVPCGQNVKLVQRYSFAAECSVRQRTTQCR